MIGNANAILSLFSFAKFVMWADLGFARVFSRDPLGDLTGALERAHDVLRAVGCDA